MSAAVVEYKGWKEGYGCGYCGAKQGKVSAGERGRGLGWAGLAGPRGSSGGSGPAALPARNMAAPPLPVRAARAPPAPKMAAGAASGRPGALT